MRKGIPFLVALALVGCQRAPSNTELVAKFTQNPEAFQALARMIREDARNQDCFVVGLDNIERYWEHGGQWTRSDDYKTKFTVSQVLKAVGLSEGRYTEYKRLFAVSGAERVTFCQGGELGPWVSTLVYRGGLSVSGCVGSIDWSQQMPPSEGDRGSGDFKEVTPLSDGWYLEFSCT